MTAKNQARNIEGSAQRNVKIQLLAGIVEA
jgi:hypothetical protein